MNKKQAEQLLRPKLKELLVSMGLKYYQPLYFARKHEDHSDILKFGGRTTIGEYGVTYKFDFCHGVRFLDVERIINPNEDNDLFPTLAGPMHFLHEDRDILKHEWALGDGDDVGAVIEQVRYEIEHFAQPFFERYATLEAIEEDVRKITWPRSAGHDWFWFGIDPVQKAELLAAIAILQGRKADALLAIEEIRQNPHFKNSPRLKNLDRIQDQYLAPNALK